MHKPLVRDLLPIILVLFLLTLFFVSVSKEINLTTSLKNGIEDYVKNISRKDISNSELSATIRSLEQWNKIKDKVTFDWIKGEKIYKNLSSEEFVYLHKKIGFEKEDMITVKIDFGNFVIKHSEIIK